VGRIAARRDSIVSQLHKGVQYLMKKNKIEVVEGRGRVRDINTIEVGAKLGPRQRVRRWRSRIARRSKSLSWPLCFALE